MNKTTNQMRRARLMVQAFEERVNRPWNEIQILANAMTEHQWAEWGMAVCGFDHPPSRDTQEMAKGLIQERVSIDARWDQLNHGNQTIWEQR